MQGARTFAEGLAPMEPPAQLYRAALASLNGAPNQNVAALRLSRAVGGNDKLLMALCVDFITRVAQDRAGTSLQRPGQSACADKAKLPSPAPLQSESEEAGHSSTADKATADAPIFSETQATTGRPDRAEKASVHEPVVAPQGERPGHSSIADKATLAAPAPLSPSPGYLRAALRAAPSVARSVLDSFKVRDGRPIGDVPWSGIDRLIAANSREAHLLALIRQHINGTPADPNTPLRELIDADMLARLIQKAAELSDADA